MAKELLSPDFTVEYLQKRLVDLQEALEKKRKGLKELPEGHLRIAQTSNKPQYYHYIEPKDFKGVFIPRTNDEFARKLAQKDYDLKVVKLLENEIHAITRCLRQLCRGGRLPTANSSTATKLGDLYVKNVPGTTAPRHPSYPDRGTICKTMAQRNLAGAAFHSRHSYPHNCRRNPSPFKV